MPMHQGKEARRPVVQAFRPAGATKKLNKNAKPVPPFQRPASNYLTSLTNDTNVVRMDLPRGCFNAGLAAIPGTDQYVMVHRPDEHSFVASILDAELKVVQQKALSVSNCADPRLVWTSRGELLMVYSSYDTGTYKTECIRAAVIGYLDSEGVFRWRKVEPFRVSMPGETRQKNWMPFVVQNRIFLIAAVFPHLVYELTELGRFAMPVSEFSWDSPWFNKEFLRGNTNPVQLADGNFLGTFHSVVKNPSGLHYYDNGCYVFEPKLPFRVLRCSNRTYLPAEAAVEPHFRKAGQIKVCFPVGMVRKGDDLLISYGDNDSAVKILKTSVEEMLATTVEIY